MPYPITIDVGSNGAADGGSTGVAKTYLSLYNPVNQQGNVDTVYITVNYACTGVKVGVFYSTGTNKYKCRSVHDCGDLSAGGHTISVALAVEVGDVIGVYVTGGSYGGTKITTVAGKWLYDCSGDCTDGAEHTFAYTAIGNMTLCLYGTGITANASISAVAATASGGSTAPAFTAEWTASPTAVAATATADALAPSIQATVTDYPSVPDVSCKVYVPLIKTGVKLFAPCVNVKCTPYKRIGTGTATVAATLVNCSCSVYKADVATDDYHRVYSGFYYGQPNYPNHIYVLGLDDYENVVFGEDTDSRIDDEEHLLPVISKLVTSQDLAGDIADAILTKARLGATLGVIEIPPNIGMELHDVVEIDDTSVNQTNADYRVAGFDLVYDTRQKSAMFKHTVYLSEV